MVGTPMGPSIIGEAELDNFLKKLNNKKTILNLCFFFSFKFFSTLFKSMFFFQSLL